MYDLIIIGMGISGISAAIYAKRANLNVLLLEGDAPGGTANKIAEINNYPGLNHISGSDFALNLFNAVNDYNIPYKLEKVTDVILEDIKTVKTTSNAYQCKYLLIATGRKPRLLNLPHINEYLGQGISTCALCDGNFYKDADVAVIGGGNSALEESLYLAKIVKTVYLIHRRENFRGEESIITKVQNTPNIKLILNEEVKELIIKDNKIQGLKLQNQDLKVQGIFLYIGSIPNTDFLKNTNIALEDGYIKTASNYETNIPGVYATGDVIKKDVYQLINAASEGAIASINIFQKEN